MLRPLLETLVLPPASLILLLLLGTALRRWKPRLGRTLQVAAVLLLLVLSLPATGSLLLGTLQKAPALPPDGPLPTADAIVVLSAEADLVGSEYGRAVAGPMTMQRVRYGAFLQRRTNLPLLMSGGVPVSGAPSLAALMADAAKDDFSVPVKWLEERSGDTWENAVFSAELLKGAGVRRVLLVTSAWHMPRARDAFAAQGLEVVPAPTAFRSPEAEPWKEFLPRWSGLKDTCLALHEWGGRLVYWFRS